MKGDEQFVSNVNEQVKTLTNTVNIPLEAENDQLVKRQVKPDKNNSQKKSREVKKQNFKFKNLPFLETETQICWESGLQSKNDTAILQDKDICYQ